MRAYILALIVALLIAGCSEVKYKAEELGEKVSGLKESVQQYWACMDGCYFMQEIHKEKFGINITKEDHDACAAICWEKYGGE